ncbi:MAG: type IV toxin-antitoxin system AbiEi family antitoxin domain-containing protein [Patescibacteria group bacterium]
MRNNNNSKINEIILAAKKLPCFTLDDLAAFETNKTYLKILLGRYAKAGKIIRLKKGFYVTKEYIDNLEKKGHFSYYLDFLNGILYEPSYLSLEYVLYRHNLLTDVPYNFTAVTKNKTAIFTNKFGNFLYYKIKDSLFCGFELVKEGEFTFLRATKTKALFDFLYLRKKILPVKEAVKELRLNVENLNRADIKDLKKYASLEGSKKIKEIIEHLFN